MSKIKVADYIINTLADLGIEKVFLVYGAANGDLVDAFTRNKNIEYVCNYSELWAGYAAEGYMRVSENFGVELVTSGPGGHSLVCPIGQFFYNSLPGLFITGQINSKFMRPSEEVRQVGFQETDIVSIVKPITKYAVCIKQPEDVRYELEKALFLMKSGRPGPVLLDIPLDIQKILIDPDKLIGYTQIKQNYDITDIAKKSVNFINDLKKSVRPCIIVGGGCHNVNRKKLLNLLTKLQIPTFPTWNAIDIISSDLDYYSGRIGTYGGPGRNFAIQNSDLILGLGTRISGRITGGQPATFARAAKLYLADIDPANLQPKLQQHRFDVGIHSDINLLLDILDTKTLSYSQNSIHKSWLQKSIEWRDKYDPFKEHIVDENICDPYLFIHKLSESLTKNDIILGDVGGNIVIMNHCFKTKQGQKFITNNGNSAMGQSFAASIGACLANKGNGQIIAVCGDGCMSMSSCELQTVKSYNLPIKIFIINNKCYGITKAFQQANFEGRFEACCPEKGYTPPDFIKVAHAYDIKAFSVLNNGGIDEAIQNALAYNGPILCDIRCDNFCTYLPKITGWESPIEDMEPRLSIEEMEENMSIPLTKFSYNIRNISA